MADQGWDVIELNNIPAASPTVDLVTGICAAANHVLVVEDHFLCPTFIIDGHEEAARQVFNKPSLRRRENYFRRHGRLLCRDMTRFADVDPYIDRFFDQHVRRWADSGTPSLFTDLRNRVFYRQLASDIDDAGWLLFSVVEHNDHPVAFHYGFDYNGVVMWYKPSFDIAYARQSPGLVLLRHVLGYAIDKQRTEFDFGVGDEEFKKRFTNRKRKTTRIRIYRNRVRFAVDVSKRNLVRGINRFLRRSSQ